ncbi:MAG TPA: nucleotide sugar dehydrogenase [Candidatus Limnocylindria bacterium]|nr:nucleotide sugar dehydrogenase [Candidatus Limnocylindria bacterium]
MRELVEKIRRKEARCGVIGLGYVGLPLALEFARAGLRVTGIDLDERKVADIRAGRSYIVDVSGDEIAEQVRAGRFDATTDFQVIEGLDTINICVPTPLRKTKDPDLTYVVSAVDEIRKYLRPGQLVILESTTYPGTTEEVVRPMLEADGLRAGRDFALAFSPERIDPGNPVYKTRNIPKVVGGVSPQCTDAARALYEQSVDTVVPVSSTQVAEMVKLLENTFRSVNIGLVNEIALMCSALRIDVWEVIEAAKTKPFGFMAFYPGPGLGGHCIPIDPFYLSWKARMNGFDARFIELAGSINESMPRFVVDKVTEALNRLCKSVRGARVHVLGVAYKAGVNDIRESPSLVVMKLLAERGAILSYSDPFVPTVREEGIELDALPLQNGTLAGVDCVVILTDHPGVDYRSVVETAPAVVDTRNALRGITSEKIIRL